MVFKMLPEGFDGPIQSSCLHAIRRHSALGASSYAIPGRSPKRKTEPGRTPVPFDLEASTGSTGGDAERVEFNSPFRRGPRYEQHFLVAVQLCSATTCGICANAAASIAVSRNYGLGVRSRVVELIFSLTPWLRCPLGNAAGSLAVTSSTYSHRFSQHR